MNELLCGKHVVLLGIGHTNAHVLRMWRMNAPPNTDLTCISDFTIATYSGMLPAVLAKQVEPKQMEIDLVQLCESAGARLITDPVEGLDRANREVCFESRRAVKYDVLSVGIGSTASLDGVDIQGESVVLVKPMQTFLNRLTKALDASQRRNESDQLRVIIVGSGVAGIEITFCLPSFLAEKTDRTISLTVVTRSDTILPEVESGTRDRVARELDRRGVEVLCGRTVTRVRQGCVTLQDEQEIVADLVIWATGAAPPPLLARLGLHLDERGFIATEPTLQSTGACGIFAVGDTGTIVGESLPKAGVYAVRQAPVLWDNMRRFLAAEPLQAYEPQHSFLKLINMGDGRAIGQWHGFSFQGRWAMRLKDWIDSRFLEKYRVRPMSMSTSTSEDSVSEMQCRGCGCKLGAVGLSSALSDVSDIELEDAAPIGRTDDDSLVASTDFFSTPFRDPFLTGRVAALHSASDIIASGALVTEALANVVVPKGDPETQQRALADILAGAKLEFQSMGANIVGGHTIVGPRMEVGFTVIGKRIGKSLVRKRNLRPGDRLFLSKPLGIGVLLAAHMRAQCSAADFEGLIDAMLTRQHPLASIADQLGVTAGTDITGFGLAGHLVEMLTASNVSAELILGDLPILTGATEQVAAGIESTLAPENRRVEASIDVPPTDRESPVYSLLFDPQTCGGMLYGVPQDLAKRFQASVKNAGLSAFCIGSVSNDSSNKPLTIR